MPEAADNDNELSDNEFAKKSEDASHSYALTPETLPERENNEALTVVGLGGSAGSIPAFGAFFENVAPDSRSAYIVVLHLSPEHESHLAELIGRSTQMPVQQVRGPVRLLADHVYVIPPGKYLEMWDGSVDTRDPETPSLGSRVAIDHFFRTLATSHGPQSAAIVFSGTGADGTLGIRQIKEFGGLTVAQSPGEAEYDAMPRSAIATGVVDYVLPAAAMPAQIAAYWETSRRMRIPGDAAPSPEQQKEGPEQETALVEVLAHVRAQTGHDFGNYKRATVLRRVGRRMQVNGVQTLPAYRDFLRSHPAEVGDLIGDLLISVTQFFRDPGAWDALEMAILPGLFDGRVATDEIRVWVCGCATGEEAYSLAILLMERAERLRQSPRIQIFATDMDSDAISRARVGIYPETIAGDVSEARLRRWFYRHNGGYQMRKEVRESVLFAHHDILRDTPFSRLDLVTCRNLLIYLNRAAQERVFNTFHFALRPDGCLMLGSSESTETADGLFTQTDKLHRLFVRRSVARAIVPPLPAIGMPLRDRDIPAGSVGSDASLTGWSGKLSAPAPTAAMELPGAFAPHFASSAAEDVRLSVGVGTGGGVGSGHDLFQSLMERYGPPTVLVNPAHNIVHLSTGSSRFLRVSEGEPTYNLLQLVHPGLRVELRAALYAAATDSTEQTRLVADIDDLPPLAGAERGAVTEPSAVRLVVRPVVVAPARGEPLVPYFLVEFQEVPNALLASLLVTVIGERDEAIAPEAARAAQALRAAEVASIAASAEVARQLEGENAALQRQLRVTIEQYEALTEEMKASNEELQATNEEMRSVAEELETGKEELQSVNEELSTVNHELKVRVEEVTIVNSDLQNFLDATHIGTIFLDRALQIKRYTPAAETLFSLIPTDLGRPLSHLTNQLDYPNLTADAASVLSRLISVEREVSSADGRSHFLARLLPYRSLDDRIEGVVLNFIDITERHRAAKALRESEAKYRTLFESIDEGFALIDLILDENGKPVDTLHLEANPAYERHTGLYGIVGKRGLEVLTEIGAWLDFYSSVARTGQPIHTEYYVEPIGRWLAAYVSRVGGEGSLRLAVVFDDITERKRREANLALLAEVSQDLARLTNIRETMDALGGKIAAHFGASLCAFSTISADAVFMTTAHAANQVGVPSTIGEHRILDYHTEAFVEAGRADEVYVVRDAAIDPRVNHTHMAALRAGAFISVPLVHDGVWRFSLSIADTAPRDWRDDEIELLREIATRLGLQLERARAEGELRKSEERLRLFFNAVSDILYRMSADWSQMILLEGKGFLADTDTSSASWLERYIPDSDKPRARAAVDEAIREKKTFELEHRVIRADGVEGWVFSRAIPLLDASGEIVEWFGAATDVTEGRKAEDALRESEGQLRIAAEAAQLGTWDWNLPANTVRWNAQHFTLLGLSPEEGVEVRPELLLDRVHPDDRERIAARLDESIATGRVYDAEFRIVRHDDGEVRWMADYGSVVQTDPSGQATRISGVMSDITERKQAENILRESEARLRTAVAIETVGVFFFQLTGGITDVNAAFVRMSGYSRDELLQVAHWEGMTPPEYFDVVRRATANLATTGQTPPYEKQLIRKDGSRWWVLCAPTRLSGSGPDSDCVDFIIDISRQKQGEEAVHSAMEAVANANLELENRVQERTAELAQVSEMRQELLRQLVTAQEQERGRIARDLHDDTGQQVTALLLGLNNLKNAPALAGNADAQTLLTGLQELAGEVAQKSHRLSFTLRPTILDDLGLMRALQNYVEEWMGWSGLPVQLEAIGIVGAEDTDTGEAADGDGERLPSEIETTIYRVAQEALTNVLRYATGSDGREPATRVTIVLQHRRGDDSGDEILTVIEDDGPGFDVEGVLNQPPGKRRLGIFGMQERARLVGGTLEVESTIDAGTSVYLRIPLQTTTAR